MTPLAFIYTAAIVSIVNNRRTPLLILILPLSAVHLTSIRSDPAENDNILIIDPAFIDLFVPAELEEMFSDTRQLNVSMSELTRLAALSGYPSDTTWFSCQVQKLEHGT